MCTEGVVTVKEYTLPTTTVPLPVGNQQFYTHKHNYTYSWFSLFVVVLLYKVTTDTTLTNTEPLHLGKSSIRFLRVSGHSIFDSWSIHNIVLCVYLFKNALYNLQLTLEQYKFVLYSSTYTDFWQLPALQLTHAAWTQVVQGSTPWDWESVNPEGQL